MSNGGFMYLEQIFKAKKTHPRQVAAEMGFLDIDDLN